MALSALMNHGAMVFIDAIDPVGTVHTRNYALGGRVYADVARYEHEVGGTFCQDVGIYYSFDSNVDMRENGLGVAEAGYTFEDTGEGPIDAHRSPESGRRPGHHPHPAPRPVRCGDPQGPRSALGLADHHPAQHAGPRHRRGPGAACLRRGRRQPAGDEAFLARSREGALPEDFQLADVFGVSFAGETREIVTYVAPAGCERRAVRRVLGGRCPSPSRDTQLLVSAHPGAEVLAT